MFFIDSTWLAIEPFFDFGTRHWDFVGQKYYLHLAAADMADLQPGLEAI